MKSIFTATIKYIRECFELFLEVRMLQVILATIVLVFITSEIKLWWISITILFFGTVFFIYSFFREQEESEQYFLLAFYVLLVAASLDLFAAIYTEVGLYDSSGILVKDESLSLYFSVVTWTTLGYGDFQPSPEARIFAATEALLGYFYMGIFIGKIIHLLSRTNKTRNEIDGAEH